MSDKMVETESSVNWLVRHSSSLQRLVRISKLRNDRHVGFWNLVGAIGFTLCGAFGYASLSKTWINYQSVLSTFWGGWAFLIGSTFQLWEAIWKEDPDSAKDGTEE
jgi:hypothetical protein